MIQILSRDTIQKIAAGEVIERPSSIVKELVENAIDAKSTRITVEIKNGGLESIEVADNGFGIEKDQLDIAFKRHATSKLIDFKDLYNLSSLGFRGEALASIVSVSRVSISTRTVEDKLGIKADFEDGIKINEKPVAKNIGTSLMVRDLFYNVPVRKNFLKSSITEANHITNLMYKLAIGNYKVGITYIKDDKIIFETKEGESLLSTLTELFGVDIVNNILEFKLEKPEYKINGYISNNKYYRANRSIQYLYVNGRYVENKQIRESIEYSYKAVIPNGRYPVFQIFIEINPQHLDVNIHPNKEKIQITLLDELLLDIQNMTKKLLSEQFSFPSIKYEDDKREYLFKQDNDIKELLNKFDNNRKDNSNSYKDNTVEINRGNSILSNNKFNYEEIILDEKEFTDSNVAEEENEYEITNIEIEESNFIQSEDFANYKYIGTIFKTYLIYEDTKNNRIFLVDQHAAHERVLYEKYMKDFKENETIVQDLIVPITIELKPDEYELYLENKNKFDKVGYETDEFGDCTIILRSVPNILGIPKNGQFFLDLIDSLNNIDSTKGMDTIYNKIIKNSCKNAVKSGDSLGLIEIKELLNQLMKCKEPYTCPHGRPTLIEMTKYELEREFLRIK